MSKEKIIKKKMGVCRVDTAQILICDPLYLADWRPLDRRRLPPEYSEAERTHEFSKDGCNRETRSKDKGGQLNFASGQAGAGVVACSGHGDGVYPVYAYFNEERRIVKLEIVFI